MKVTWLQSDFQPQTALHESLTGVTLPASQVALSLPGTVCDQEHFAYRGRYRVCKGPNCSNFSEWWLYWDLS
jgi:hypothetical protein